MSRVVPTDRALSDRDRQHLRNLGSAGDHLEKRIDAEFPPDPDALAEFERSELKRHADLNGMGLATGEQDRLIAENADLRRQLAEALAANADLKSSAPSYAGWKKSDLEGEIDRINEEDPEANLEKGTVVSMVTALTAYWAEAEEPTELT